MFKNILSISIICVATTSSSCSAFQEVTHFKKTSLQKHFSETILRLHPSKKVRFAVSVVPSNPSEEIEEMDRDDDEGVGYVRESHYLTSPTVEQQQAMALLQIPRHHDGREGSISSSVSDLDVPIYSSENLTTSPKRPASGVSRNLFVSNNSNCLFIQKNGLCIRKGEKSKYLSD